MMSWCRAHQLRLYVPVPQNYASVIRPGMQVQLSVPEHPGQTFNAKLIGNSTAIDQRSGTLMAQFVALNPGDALMPGDYAEAVLSIPANHPTADKPCHTGPAAAICGPKAISSALINKASDRRVEANRSERSRRSSPGISTLRSTTPCLSRCTIKRVSLGKSANTPRPSCTPSMPRDKPQ